MILEVLFLGDTLNKTRVSPYHVHFTVMLSFCGVIVWYWTLYFRFQISASEAIFQGENSPFLLIGSTFFHNKNIPHGRWLWPKLPSECKKFELFYFFCVCFEFIFYQIMLVGFFCRFYNCQLLFLLGFAFLILSVIVWLC